MLTLADLKDLLDYLKNLTGNLNARFKNLVAESFNFVQYLFKTDIGTTNVVLLHLRWLNCRQTMKKN